MHSIDIQKQITTWKEQNVITAEQAKKMAEDIRESQSEQRTNSVIVSLSTIGAILVGLGAILFVGSNWREMGNLLKTAVLVGSTAISYVTGYILQYERENYPKVGAALQFLGTLLFGASVFLIAQMYHVNAHNHTLLLVWLAGVLPLAYGFRSLSSATLSIIIFFVWIGFFLFRGQRFNEDVFFFLPIIYALAGLLALAAGSLHHLKPALNQIGRAWQIAGLKIGMFSLFLLTFDMFHVTSASRWYGIDRNVRGFLEESSVQSTIILLLVLTIIALAAVIALNPRRRPSNTIEHGIAYIPIVCIVLYLYVPAMGAYSLLLFNALLIGLSLFLLVFGYMREDMQFVNTGIFWTSLFILTKYFDWFWGLLPRSLFFVVGGALLVLGGLSIERKRRDLKQNFSQ